ncbi:MAG TPA: methionyl-tRNA formyltransferase, partial [Halomonas sp.]|nr:methionyl-tRNA formyltransferase [Halomonas sp.]
RPLAGTSDAPPGTIVEMQKDAFTVVCSESLLQVLKVQLPGKGATVVTNVLHSRPLLFAPGNVFGA